MYLALDEESEKRLHHLLKLTAIIFGVFTWLMMMVTFMPLAGAGFFGAKVVISTHIGLLVLNLVFGAVLGVTYGRYREQ
jgi:hypothetical protein